MYPTLFCAIASPSLNREQFNSVEVQSFTKEEKEKPGKACKIRILPFCYCQTVGCTMQNQYTNHDITVQTEHCKRSWFQFGKGVRKGCVISPYLFNLYAEDILKEVGLEEDEYVFFKFERRNINNLPYAKDTTLIAENAKDYKL